MKLATAAYSMDVLTSWAQYEDKISRWVSEAVGQGAGLLLFPEYGAMELATLAGLDVAGDLEASLHAVSERVPDADDLHARLAREHKVHICAASAPVFAGGARPVNRARFFAPSGAMIHQDKQIMTKFERDPWDVVPGDPLRIIDTALGRVGILICYDSEFPLLGRALKDVDILLVPSCTEALAGYWRVRIGAMARALENQCVAVMASTVGDCRWSEAVDENTGAGGIFGPPDLGFPSTGVLAEGALNVPGWTFAEIAEDAVARVRRDGVVANRTHWEEQDARDLVITSVSLR
ncbi:carbon-nitrogen hydrolase family protein [Primorskyibacter aestuariivivens]|uniref:carbon-nitrogen hydrolase family protein n=1 Tax=Primorskyibacter aestuariivivens TaxID=1888912 RepID=UPI00230009F4|nr:carbon-nitrogen hydrolase family protein [Primorskyibacter aestuariivivens]MDA7428540.1 carbon-nitrogen hydrolase family protein [Primorskyibacter aestuariivivens]